MQYQFDEKIDLAIQRSVRAAVRLLKERRRLAQESGILQAPLTYEEFASVLGELMESNKAVEMNKLRTSNLRELLNRAWAQKLLNYATQKRLRDAYSLLRRRY